MKLVNLIIFLIFISPTFCLIDGDYVFIQNNANEICLFIVGILIPICIITKFNNTGLIKFNYIDLLVIIFISIKAGYFYYIESEINLLIYVLILLIFLFLKTVASKNLLAVIIALFTCGAIESIVGIFQLYDIILTWNLDFPVTGLFYNPGVFANLLVVIFPITLAFFLSYPNKIIKYLSLFNLGLILIIIPATISRTSILALVFCILPIAFSYKKLNINFKIYKFNWIAAIIFSLLLFVLISYKLYQLKRESANGRILIYKVAIEMIKDKPLLGFGSFAKYYNHYQAQFLKKHDVESDILFTVEDEDVAFNEYLHTAIEYGIPVCILFIAIIVLTSFSEFGIKDKYLSGFKGAIISFAFCCFFSYPLQNIATEIYFWGIVAIISSNARNNYSFTLPNFYLIKVSIIITSLTLIIIYAYTLKNTYMNYKKWFKAQEFVSAGENLMSLKYYEDIYQDLKKNRYFSYYYGKALYNSGKYEKAIDVLNNHLEIYPFFSSYMLRGKCYEKTINYTKAFKDYNYASCIIPYRLYPYVAMMNICKLQNDTLKAAYFALKIVITKEKFKTEESKAYKMDALNYLKQINKNQIPVP